MSFVFKKYFPRDFSFPLNFSAPFSNVTCKVDGISYKESDQFYPSNSCTECICKEGFKGEFVEPFCKRINCPVQLDKAEFIAKRCAPVYLTKTEGVLCCPVIFACRKFCAEF